MFGGVVAVISLLGERRQTLSRIFSLRSKRSVIQSVTAVLCLVTQWNIISTLNTRTVFLTKLVNPSNSQIQDSLTDWHTEQSLVQWVWCSAKSRDALESSQCLLYARMRNRRSLLLLSNELQWRQLRDCDCLPDHYWSEDQRSVLKAVD